MTQVQLLTDIGSWLINIAFLVSALFPLITALYWPWWASPWGQNIVGLEICIAATLLPSVLYRDFGILNAALRWIQVASLGMVIMIVVWRAVMIWHAQRQDGLGWLASLSGLSRGRTRVTGCGPSFRVYGQQMWA